MPLSTENRTAPCDSPKAPSRRPQGALQAPSRRPQGALKAPSRRPQGALKAPSRRPQGALKAPSRRPQGALKAPSRRPQGSLEICRTPGGCRPGSLHLPCDAKLSRVATSRRLPLDININAGTAALHIII